MKLGSGDKIFFVLVLCIVFAGFAIFSSAALGLLARESSTVSKDIIFQAGLGLGLGFVALIITRAIPLTFIKRLSPYIYVVTIIFTALVFIPGIGFQAGGATRWIALGFTFLRGGWPQERASLKIQKRGYFLSFLYLRCRAFFCLHNQTHQRLYLFSLQDG
jgi:cell division protein FtsW (lipid II flippase)